MSHVFKGDFRLITHHTGECLTGHTHTHNTQMHTFHAFVTQYKFNLNDFRDSILTEMWSDNNERNEHAHSCVLWVMSDELCVMCDVLSVRLGNVVTVCLFRVWWVMSFEGLVRRLYKSSVLAQWVQCLLPLSIPIIPITCSYRCGYRLKNCANIYPSISPITSWLVR